MNKLLLGGIFLLLSNTAMADVNGVMDDNGDGTYTVVLTNESGNQYTGTAVPQKDGTLSVNVHDHDGDSFSGRGKGYDGEYNVELQNDETGGYVDSRILPKSSGGSW